VILRNLWKHKVFSSINLIGLTISLAGSMLIYLYVSYEYSYDSYHTKGRRICRLVLEDQRREGTFFGAASIAMGPILKMNYPEVQQVTQLSSHPAFVSNGMGAAFQENNVLYVSPNFFAVFSYQFVKGDPAKALSKPSSAVLTEAASRKYFGTADLIGKSLRLNGEDIAQVTGVIQDMPANSHFRSDILISEVNMPDTALAGKGSAYANLWNAFPGETYLLFPAGYDPDQFQPKLKAFMDENASKLTNEHDSHFQLLLEPLKNIYLHGKYTFLDSGNSNNVYIFSFVAVFILIIACINFINLTTARAGERAKETGIRKIIGSSRIQLIKLFWGESALLGFFAFFTACGLCAAFIPLFNEVCGKTISRGLFEHASNVEILFLLSLLLGLTAGIYPAIMLSSFKPINVLKGRLHSSENGSRLRQVLVVLQFTISITLIVGILVIYLQLDYMRNQPLGFKKDQMLVIDFGRDTSAQRHIEAIKQEMKGIPHVLSAATSSGVPNSGFEPVGYKIQNSLGTMEDVSLAMYMIDNDFLSQFHMDLLAGRGFSKDFPGPFLILNETAVKKLGYASPADIIDKPISGEGGHGRVIGVVRDFHFRSLREQIEPLLFGRFSRANRYLTLNIASANASSTIAAIGTKWRQLVPGIPFTYFFLDEAIDKQYRAEISLGNLFLYFGVVAILIASLGLLGLSLFNVTQRTKEIAVRKTLGAEVTNIIVLLTRDHLRLVLISFIIASPLAWLLMTKWLRGFAYRIEIPWWTFSLAAGIALTIAMLTIFYQTVKAACTNPVIGLRAE